jgi:hypothetical protein
MYKNGDKVAILITSIYSPTHFSFHCLISYVICFLKTTPRERTTGARRRHFTPQKLHLIKRDYGMGFMKIFLTPILVLFFIYNSV